MLVSFVNVHSCNVDYGKVAVKKEESLVIYAWQAGIRIVIQSAFTVGQRQQQESR